MIDGAAASADDVEQAALVEAREDRLGRLEAQPARFHAGDDLRNVGRLDREAAELLRYQRAYDASARIIQVARETMQTILDVL